MKITALLFCIVMVLASTPSFSDAQQVFGKPQAPSFENLVQMLKSTDPKVRMKAAYHLVGSAAPQALPALTEAMGDESPEVRMMAAKALGQIPSEKSLAPLMAALEDEDMRVRASAAEALGMIGDPSAVPKLKAMLDDAEKTPRLEAAVALERIGDEAGRALLIEMLDDESIKYRRMALMGLTHSQDEAIVPELYRVLDEEDPYIVNTVILFLEKEGGTKALREGLSSAGPVMQVCMAAALSEAGEKGTADMIIGNLESESPEARKLACRALAKLEEEGAVPALSKTLRNDEDGKVRALAAMALGTIGDMRAINPLLETLQDEKSTAYDSGPSRFPKPLKGMLAQETPGRSPSLVEDILNMNRSGRIADGSKVLVRGASDTKVQGRTVMQYISLLEMTAWALGELGSEQAIPALEKFAAEKEGALQEAAQKAINKIRDPSADQTQPPVEKAAEPEAAEAAEPGDTAAPAGLPSYLLVLVLICLCAAIVLYLKVRSRQGGDSTDSN